MHKIVRETLFDDSSYCKNQISEILNEGFNKETFSNLIKKFNKEHNLNLRKYIAIGLITLYLINVAAKNNKWIDSHNYEIQKAATELTTKNEINLEDITASAEVSIKSKESLPIFSVNSPGLIDAINDIKPGRLSNKKISHYDKYDKDIFAATKSLKAKGEDADPNLIKAIMLIETGMKPVKNKWGFEGFPQTQQHIIDGVNKRNKTSFTMQDMYDAEKSAEFIYYLLKGIQRSMYVEDIDDMVIAYNWGMGNLGKYKRGETKLRKQAEDYVKMINALQKYFS